ncbi:MAG: signal peptidase II [Dehalococcoidales bacterium]|jgi:signal peptidase II
MPKANFRLASWRIVLVFLPAALILAADQITKVWIRSHLAVGETLFEAGIFSITRVSPNTGAAFGIFRGGMGVLTIISLAYVILFLLYAFVFYRRFPALDNRWNNLAFGLILGGTMGNLAERLNTSLGGVTDFISVGWFPVFNIADSAITVGAVLLAISLLLSFQGDRQALV